jgi:hypothetical protein
VTETPAHGIIIDQAVAGNLRERAICLAVHQAAGKRRLLAKLLRDNPAAFGRLRTSCPARDRHRHAPGPQAPAGLLLCRGDGFPAGQGRPLLWLGSIGPPPQAGSLARLEETAGWGLRVAPAAGQAAAGEPR